MTPTTSSMPAHGPDQPSDWVVRWARAIAPQGLVLDLACGGGRHTRYLVARGLRIHAVDRDASALAALNAIAGVTVQQADLENGPWPLAGQNFNGVVVTNYLHRPLLPHIVRALSPGGVLIYETFAVGNERYGSPSNPDFLLKPGELLDAVRGRLRVVAYEDVQVTVPRPACIQRICATAWSGEV